MRNFRTGILLFIIYLLCFSSEVSGEVIVKDIVWKGVITLNDDVLIPKGVTLTVLPGTEIRITPSDRTKTDPEYLSSLLEITVRGRLEIEGTKKAPVMFHIKGKRPSDIWAGIIVDGGSAYIRSCNIQDAETGILVLKGSVNIWDSFIHKNKYGLVAWGKLSSVRVENTKINENEYGVFELDDSQVIYRNSYIEKNEKKDRYMYAGVRKSSKGIKNRKSMSTYKRSNSPCRKSTSGMEINYEITEKDITKKYKDEVLLADTIWRGRIEIDGLIRVPENVRLIIVPGTIVEFRKKDTNNDGIGENGIMMQGVLIAKGTRENPIIFRSAEKQPGMGDWDAINIMNSDGAQNLVEFSRIEDAYRGLHFHFANVMVNRSILKNNYRAIQFQESAVELRGNYIFNNKSGIKARDSEINFTNNSVFNNINGANFFRSVLNAGNNKITANTNEGLKIREGTTTVQENLIDCNRFGLMVSDSFFGRFNRNVILHNFQTGVSIRDSDNVDLSENFIQGSGFNGINIMSSGAVIKNNNISENGERGIGIRSFTGTITGNTFVRNRLYAIDNDSTTDVLAPLNWWGGRRADKYIYDKFDDTERGVVIFSPVLLEPGYYKWPQKNVSHNMIWHGSFIIEKPLEVISGSVLTLAPGTKVALSEGVGIKVSESKIIAKGREKNRISFSSINRKPEQFWDEILLEYATGSVFSYCDFEYATWALHSHFTALKITDSVFRKNDGGIRFRSGPVEISGSLFTENRIGLRAFLATALIKENDFVNNETGIFVRQKGSGLTITNNNIFLNENYNIRVGDFNTEDVNAKGNWWGTNDPAKTIFDGRIEPGVGKVIYEPYLDEQIVFEEETN